MLPAPDGPGKIEAAPAPAGDLAAVTGTWTNWVGEVIDGAFPLRRFLGGTDHSGVFLTEHKAQNLRDAAIKIVPADPALTESQLTHWRAAAALSHPHLIRLLDSGRCQLGGRQFLFVAMEYAEQTLSQILRIRALTPDEVGELLPPTLDALAFLHREGLVQGQLKPPNILVVNDQLKLASDTIRPAGESAMSIAKPSSYDPPEAKSGRISAAGDTWALGMTMVEALTQSPPAWSDERSESVSLPTNLPPTFVDVVRRCLSRNPAERPTVTELEAQFSRPPQAPVASTARAPSPRKSPDQRLAVPTIAAVVIILFAVVWAGLRLHGRKTNPEQTVSSAARIAAQQEAPPAKIADSEPSPSRPVARPPDRGTRPPADASLSVLHEEIPQVPRSARDTIHGHIQVAVRVTVDGSGNVVDEVLEHPGPSRYFARLASAAARGWRFAPAHDQPPRGWILWFDFTRSGATGRAVVPRKSE